MTRRPRGSRRYPRFPECKRCKRRPDENNDCNEENGVSGEERSRERERQMEEKSHDQTEAHATSPTYMNEGAKIAQSHRTIWESGEGDA